jgi:AcrR family transcriptional regulator
MNQAKEKLLTAAGKTFSRYGFYKTSMDEIAKTARKAKGSLYYHFNSKEFLFKEVVASELSFLKEELTIIFNLKHTDSREILKAYMLKRMEILKASINYQETLRPEFYEFYEFLNELKTEMDNWEKLKIINILGQGIQNEELDLPGEISIHAEVLVMTLKGLETPFFIKGEYERLESHFDSLISVITKGISKV